MASLILHPTDVSQWYALVNEAELASYTLLNEETESYLVFLLMRFAQSAALLESILALDFLESMHKPVGLQRDMLRDVGDKSLLFCGLFPGIAQRRHVDISYFEHLGRTAYWYVGALHNPASAPLYFELGERFMQLQQVLQTIRREFWTSDPTRKGRFSSGDWFLH